MHKLVRPTAVYAALITTALATWGTAAHAATPPETVEKCLEQLNSLVAKAHAVDMLDDQIDFAENELGRMEGYCVSSHFAEAMTAADEVERILATNK